MLKNPYLRIAIGAALTQWIAPHVRVAIGLDRAERTPGGKYATTAVKAPFLDEQSERTYNIEAAGIDVAVMTATYVALGMIAGEHTVAAAVKA